MVRKFDKEKFIERFETMLKENHDNWSYPPIIQSITRIAVETCRQLNFAQGKNRDVITETIKEWWNNLPKATDERYEHMLFGKNARIASAWGATWISLRRDHGVNSGNLIVYY